MPHYRLALLTLSKFLPSIFYRSGVYLHTLQFPCLIIRHQHFFNQITDCIENNVYICHVIMKFAKYTIIFPFKGAFLSSHAYLSPCVFSQWFWLSTLSRNRDIRTAIIEMSSDVMVCTFTLVPSSYPFPYLLCLYIYRSCICHHSFVYSIPLYLYTIVSPHITIFWEHYMTSGDEDEDTARHPSQSYMKFAINFNCHCVLYTLYIHLCL